MLYFIITNPSFSSLGIKPSSKLLHVFFFIGLLLQWMFFRLKTKSWAHEIYAGCVRATHHYPRLPILDPLFLNRTVWCDANFQFLSSKPNRTGEQKTACGQKEGAKPSRGHGKETVFISKENNQTDEVEETPVGKMSVVCWRRDKKKLVIIQPFLTSHKHFI